LDFTAAASMSSIVSVSSQPRHGSVID
ncbi:hypothetical protein VCHENC02_4557B, partial [Vibrio harveyi]